MQKQVWGCFCILENQGLILKSWFWGCENTNQNQDQNQPKISPKSQSWNTLLPLETGQIWADLVGECKVLLQPVKALGSVGQSTVSDCVSKKSNINKDSTYQNLILLNSVQESLRTIVDSLWQVGFTPEAKIDAVIIGIVQAEDSGTLLYFFFLTSLTKWLILIPFFLERFMIVGSRESWDDINQSSFLFVCKWNCNCKFFVKKDQNYYFYVSFCALGQSHCLVCLDT